MSCSCGLWQLGGIPCVHAVAVYLSLSKEPRLYVHKDFSMHTFKGVYNNYLEPIESPEAWPKSNNEDILPPDIRVLPGRPKKCRRIDPRELQQRAEKMAEMKAKAKKVQADRDAVEAGSSDFVASRRGAVIHCTNCGGQKHNARTCVAGAPPVVAEDTPAEVTVEQAEVAADPADVAPPVSKRRRKNASQASGVAEPATQTPAEVAVEQAEVAAEPADVAPPVSKRRRKNASQATGVAEPATQPTPVCSTRPDRPLVSSSQPPLASSSKTKNNLRRSSRNK